MTGPFGTTGAPWRVSGDNCPECWIIEDGEGYFIAQCEDRRGFASLDAVANAKAIAQVPAMLALVDAVADWVNIEDVRDMARAIVRELEGEK